ncbi:16787_t:CDS:2 [Rhizophagus irregularis]|nr:16787_t:CDS:2 [Rhizophagus irregularis]
MFSWITPEANNLMPELYCISLVMIIQVLKKQLLAQKKTSQLLL